MRRDQHAIRDLIRKRIEEDPDLSDRSPDWVQGWMRATNSFQELLPIFYSGPELGRRIEAQEATRFQGPYWEAFLQAHYELEAWLLYGELQ